MARGILAGIGAGIVAAGLGLGAASLVLGPVEMTPESELAGAGAGTQTAVTAGEEQAADTSSTAEGDAPAPQEPQDPVPQDEDRPEAVAPVSDAAGGDTDTDSGADTDTDTGRDTDTGTGTDTGAAAQDSAPEAPPSGADADAADADATAAGADPEALPTDAPETQAAPEAPAPVEETDAARADGADAADTDEADTDEAETGDADTGEADTGEAGADAVGPDAADTGAAKTAEPAGLEPEAMEVDGSGQAGLEIVEITPEAMPDPAPQGDAPGQGGESEAVGAASADSQTAEPATPAQREAAATEPAIAPEPRASDSTDAPLTAAAGSAPPAGDDPASTDALDTAQGDAAEIALLPGPEAPDAPEAAADPAAGVVTGRLPAIGAAPAAAPEADVPALRRNALAFADLSDAPRMAVLLVDTGTERADFGDLGRLPFSVTVAVDAGAPDAAEAIAFWRAAGAEVVLTVALPEGATATDVEVTFEAFAPLMSDVAAVLIDEASGFQTLGEAAVQVAARLSETGHGLITFPAGLNTGHKTAVKEGIRAGLVFRDLDGAGQAGPVMRRFLDNAAFRAGNEEGVIVLARTRAETVQTLLEWSLGNRAQSVTLAPASAVLDPD